ncbi:hypothetical protein ACOSQ3_008491 [Xanthoceras sorbifolium]
MSLIQVLFYKEHAYAPGLFWMNGRMVRQVGQFAVLHRGCSMGDSLLKRWRQHQYLSTSLFPDVEYL